MPRLRQLLAMSLGYRFPMHSSTVAAHDPLACHSDHFHRSHEEAGSLRSWTLLHATDSSISALRASQAGVLLVLRCTKSGEVLVLNRAVTQLSILVCATHHRMYQTSMLHIFYMLSLLC